MSVLPLIVVWAMLAGAAPVLAILPRPRPLFALAAAVPLLALPLWWLARPAAPAVAPLLGGRWATGEVPWHLTGVALLLLMVEVAQAFAHRTDAPLPARRLGGAFALAAAALPTVWAGDARTQVNALALFAVVWAALTWLVAGKASTASVALRRTWALAAAVFLRWAAVAPGQWGLAAGLAAAAVLLGLWPDAADNDEATNDPVVARGLPVVVGAGVLTSVLGGAALSPTLAVLTTAAGLLAMLLGLGRFDGRSPSRTLRPLLAALALLAGVWAGQAALLPAARLAVFAPLVLSMADDIGLRPLRWAAVGAGLAALTGLPFIVGFATLSRLYEAWRAAGGFLLLAVAAALLALWLAALLLTLRPRQAAVTPAARLDLTVLPAAVAGVGLLHWDRAVLDTHPLVWATLLLAAVVGLALGRFVPGLAGWLAELRPALAPALPAGLPAGARRAQNATAAAISDAIDLLEGANGLLLLLALVLLLLWIGG